MRRGSFEYIQSQLSSFALKQTKHNFYICVINWKRGAKLWDKSNRVNHCDSAVVFRADRFSSLHRHTYCFQNCKSNCAKVMGDGPASDLDVLTFADFPWPASLFPSLTDSIFSLPSFTHPFNYSLSSVLPSVTYFAREMVVDVKYRVRGRNKRDRKALLDVTHDRWMLTCYLRCMNTHTYHTFMYAWQKKIKNAWMCKRCLS